MPCSLSRPETMICCPDEITFPTTESNSPVTWIPRSCRPVPAFSQMIFLSGSKMNMPHRSALRARGMNAERCGIFIFDPDKKIIWLKAGTGLQERGIQVTGEFDSVVGKVISSGQHIIVSGLDKEHGIHKQTDEITGFVTRDILCTPIKSLDGRRVMGAVQLLNKKDGKSFNDDDLSLITEMAHYLELTMEN